MNLSLQAIPADILASYEERARARGVTVEALLVESLIKCAPCTPPVALGPDEWERALDECLDSFPAVAPLPDSAFDREQIYGREDHWS